MNKRKLLQSTLVLALAAAASGGLLAQDKPIKVGATAGPHSQILEQVKKVAERDGLKIQIVEFTDYIQPNAALATGDLGIRYGYQRFLPEIMLAVVVVLEAFVQLVHSLGDWAVRRLSHK